MSQKDWPGSVLSKTPVTPSGSYANSAASGIWSMNDVAYWVKQQNWPGTAVGDPYFYDVSLLLTGDGTNGAQNNTIVDTSGNSFALTNATNNWAQGTFSPYGNLWSNYVDGSGDYLVAADSTAFDLPADYTVEFWVYPTTLGSSRSMFCIGNAGSSDGLLLYWSIGDSRIKMYCGGTVIGGSITTSANTWTHVALVRSGSGSNNTTLYINGVSSGQATNTTSFTGVAGNGVSIGAAYYGSYSEETVGYFSNVRVVKGTAIYTSAFTPSTIPLTAVSGTSLLTCQSNRFKDNSSNNFTLTVNGSPSVQRFSPFNPTAPYSASTIGGSLYSPGGASVTSSNGTNIASNQNFTMEGWFYFTAVADNVCVAITSGDLSVLQGASGNGMYSYDGSFHSWGIAFPLNQWVHFVMMRSGSTAYTWVNGIYQTSFSYTASWYWDGRDHGNLLRLLGQGSTREVGNFADMRFSTVARYNTSGTNISVPTSPYSSDANTLWIINGTNAGIPDSAMMNDLQTVGNAQVSTSVKKYGTGSLAFDGTGDYLATANKPVFQFGAGDFTIEMWLYANSASTTHGLIASNQTGAGYWASLIYTGTLYWQSQNGATNLLSYSYSGYYDQWVHVAFVRNNGTITLYLNGVSKTSASDSTNYNGSSGNYNVGFDLDNSAYLTGYIDDLRITKGYARYTSSFTPPTSAFPTF